VIAEDAAGERTMGAWAIHETRMRVGQRSSVDGREGWTVTWKGRGWDRSFEDYLALVRIAGDLTRGGGMLAVPSVKYHLPALDEPFRDAVWTSTAEATPAEPAVVEDDFEEPPPEPVPEGVVTIDARQLAAIVRAEVFDGQRQLKDRLLAHQNEVVDQVARIREEVANLTVAQHQLDERLGTLPDQLTETIAARMQADREGIDELAAVVREVVANLARGQHEFEQAATARQAELADQNREQLATLAAALREEAAKMREAQHQLEERLGTLPDQFRQVAEQIRDQSHAVSEELAGIVRAEAAALANHAAGIVVGKFGPATLSPEELLASLKYEV